MAKNADYQSGIGPRLSSLLKENRLSNRAAAEIAGVSPTSIHDWKSGVTPTDFVALAKLADHMNVQFRYLLIGDNEIHELPTAQLMLPEGFAQDADVFTGFCEVKIRRVKSTQDRESAREASGE